MKPTSLVFITVIFLLGTLCGYYFALHQNPAPAALQQDSASHDATPDTGVTADPQPSFVWLQVERNGGKTRIPAIVLNQPRAIVASLYDVFPANRVSLQRGTGAPALYPQVIAANEKLQLIALSADNFTASGASLANVESGLFLGKDFTLRLPDRTVAGRIDSPLQRLVHGTEFYAVDIPKEFSEASGPIVNNNNEVVGFQVGGLDRNITEQTERAVSGAVDSQYIAELLAEHRLRQSLSVRDFTKRWSQSAGALRRAAQKLYAVKQWDEAYATSMKLWQTSPAYLDSDKLLLINSAVNAAYAKIRSDNTDNALAITTLMRNEFGSLNIPWCLIDAQAWERLGNLQVALQNLQECLALNTAQLNPVTAALFGDALLRPQLIEYFRDISLTLASGSGLSHEQRQAILGAANQLERHYALLRQLGDNEYELGNYASAGHYYAQAIQLNPELQDVLADRLRKSQQRASSVPTSEVAFEQRRNAIVVSARINNSPLEFRMMVDTGATFSAIGRATLIKLGLTSAVNLTSAPLIELDTAGGRIYAQRYSLESISVGDAQVNHVPVVILENLEGVDGLIGLSFLEHFDVSIDQQAGKLLLTRR